MRKATNRGFSIIGFIAEWCPYSLLARTMAAQAAERINGSLRWVDVDSERDIVEQFNVDSVPTLILLRNDEMILRWESQTNPEDVPEYFSVACGVHPTECRHDAAH